MLFRSGFQQGYDEGVAKGYEDAQTQENQRLDAEAEKFGEELKISLLQLRYVRR